MMFLVILLLILPFVLLSPGKWIDLTNGVPAGPYLLKKGDYIYFDFVPVLKDSGVVIAAYPVRGDSDIYASCTFKYPNQHQYTWKSILHGADHIGIPKDQVGHCEKLYIGVYGHTDDEFSILSYSMNTTIDISLGSEQPGFVMKSSYDYYRFKPDQPLGNVTLCVTSRSTEDVDLFVGVGYRPTMFHYRYSSTSIKKDEQISFPAVENQDYYFGVMGYTGNVNYMISLNDI